MASGPPVDKQNLWKIFQRLDVDRNGFISAEELQEGLSNGTWTPFNLETVQLMIGMFDKTFRSHLNFDEFTALWQYVSDWQSCFRSFDADNSGSIDKHELKTVLTNFGYRLSDQVIDVLLHRFNNADGAIIFDDFIQCCIILYNLTSTFRQYDSDHDGVITIQYEQFLSMVFGLDL